MTTTTDTSDRIDILPLLLIAMGLIYLFILLRPPVLMLLYDLNRQSMPAGEPVTSTTPGTGTPAPPAPMRAPQLPIWLQQLVAQQPLPPPVPGMDVLDQEIARLTNAARQKYQHPNLEIDPKLREIATRHSQDMLARNYMDHISPDGIGPAQRVGKYYRRLFGLTGENVALKDSPPAPPPQTAKDFMDMWMNSPGHRRNILSPDYNRGATGCYQQQNPGQDQRRCTQLFAQAYAFAEQDIPETVSARQTIAVSIRPLAGVALPTRIAQLNLANGSEVSWADLNPNAGGTAGGQLILNGPPGVYTLQLHVPDPAVPGRYLLVPGPYVTVQ
jgi:uncharacterized protein YkwD